jgi:hypothetical protein
MQQDERAFVGNPEIARERQRALALYLIAEDCDGSEIAAQGQFVRSE